MVYIVLHCVLYLVCFQTYFIPLKGIYKYINIWKHSSKFVFITYLIIILILLEIPLIAANISQVARDKSWSLLHPVARYLEVESKAKIIIIFFRVLPQMKGIWRMEVVINFAISNLFFKRYTPRFAKLFWRGAKHLTPFIMSNYMWVDKVIVNLSSIRVFNIA